MSKDLNKSSGMLWYDILTRVIMPIQAILCFVAGAIMLVFSTYTILDVTEKIMENETFWAEIGEKFESAGLAVEKFQKLTEVSEIGVFMFAICLFFVAIGVFMFVSRSSLLYFEKKSLKIFLALHLGFAGLFLFIAFCLWIYEFALPLIIVSLIAAAITLAWGILNYIYLKGKSYQFTI